MSEDHAPLRGGTHIFSWGRGDFGQLGTELDLSQPHPVLVQAVEDKDIAHVAASVFNSAFITGGRTSIQAAYPCSRCAIHTHVVQDCSLPCSCAQLMPSCGQQAVMTAVSWVTKGMRPSCIPAECKPLMLMGSARLHVASSTCWLWLMVELCAPGVQQTWASWVCSHIRTCTCRQFRACITSSISNHLSVIVCICIIIVTTADTLVPATPYPCFHMALPAALTSLQLLEVSPDLAFPKMADISGC